MSNQSSHSTINLVCKSRFVWSPDPYNPRKHRKYEEWNHATDCLKSDYTQKILEIGRCDQVKSFLMRSHNNSWSRLVSVTKVSYSVNPSHNPRITKPNVKGISQLYLIYTESFLLFWCNKSVNFNWLATFRLPLLIQTQISNFKARSSAVLEINSPIP